MPKIIEPQTQSITMRELARLANVNQSTISRSLNGDPRINPHRVREIRKLAEKYGYRPKPLRTQKTDAIGLLIASNDPNEPDHPFINRILLLAEQTLAHLGLHIHVAFTPRQNNGKTIELPGIIAQNRIDGLLLAGHPSKSLVEQIRKFNLPMVGLNDSSKRLGIPTVRLDARDAIRDAITQLHKDGHQRIGMALHLLKYTTNRMRKQAYLKTMRSLKLPVNHDTLITDLPFGLEGGALAIEQLLALPKPPTAILMGNDWMAMGATQALAKKGMSVPNDISLIGHDDLWFAADPTMNLSTIHRDESALVTCAIELLTHQINSPSNTAPPPEEHLVPARMIWRASTSQLQRNKKKTPGEV